MSPKPDGRIGSALIPIGTAAVVAGCGGGGGSAAGPVVPANRGTATVQISLTIPAASQALIRKTQTINAAANSIGVRIVASPAPAATPTETTFAISSGPVPTSTTLTVTGVSGPDTITVAAYGSAAGVSRAPLDASTQNATLSPNGTNTLSVTLNPVAYGASIAVSGGSGQVANALQWSPFENWTNDQTGNFTVVPFDAFGNVITGSIGNVLNVSGPTGVTASAITAAGTAGITYSKGSNGVGPVTLVPSLVPSGTTVPGAPSSSLQTVTLQPDYYLFGVDSTGDVGVYDPLRATQVAHQNNPPLSHSRAPQSISGRITGHRSGSRSAQSIYGSIVQAMDATAAANCSGGTVAAVAAIVGNFQNNGNGVDIATVSPSGSVSFTFVPWTGTSVSLGTPSTVSIDPATCLAYVGDSLGYLGVVQGATSASPSLAIYGGNASPAYLGGTPGYVYGVLVANGSLYVAKNNSPLSTFPLGSPPNGSLSTVPFSGSVGFFNNPALVLAGGTVYASYAQSPSFSCVFQPINGSTTVQSNLNSPFLQIVGTQSGIYGADQHNGSTGYLEQFLTPFTPGETPTVVAVCGFTGVAASKDATNSTLWLSAANGFCGAFSLPITSTSPLPVAQFSSSTIGTDYTLTGLAIAP